VRHVRMMTVCLVALCGIGALAVANASAELPEWGKCVKVPITIKGKVHKKGSYANSNCTEKAGGEYEFVKGTVEFPDREFTNTMTSPEAVLTTAHEPEVRCTAETATGELSGSKEVSNVRVKFKGCKTKIPTLACENVATGSVGEETVKYVEGEIETRALKGKLGYISGKGTATPVVGLELEPREKDTQLAFFGCGDSGEHPTPFIFTNVGANLSNKKSGGAAIISPISPINKMGTETTQVYAQKKVENPETHDLENVLGAQEPSAFENGKPAFLEAQTLDWLQEEKWETAAQEETAVTKLNSGEELEIKA
jgi:hypothetical protein